MNHQITRRLLKMLFVVLLSGMQGVFGKSRTAVELNLALVAQPSCSFVSGHERLDAINSGYAPRYSGDHRKGAYGNWPRSGTQWVEYAWSKAISTSRVDVYWFADGRGIRLPVACRLKYWTGKEFVDVPNAKGLGVEANRFNETSFDEISTTRIRLEMDSEGTFSTGILQWRIYDTGKTSNFPPSVKAGPDRVVLQPNRTYLTGEAKDDGKPSGTIAFRWSKVSGPGIVSFGSPSSASTDVKFGRPGVYRLRLAAGDGELDTSAFLSVSVRPPAPKPLAEVATNGYTLSSPFWKPRIKALIVNWIPHCAKKIDDPNLPEGGIQNFVEAAKKLAGQSGAKHTGAVFANAWVYNTLEAMCLAQSVDAEGDKEILAAQAGMRKTIADWIPKILAAQEPDGYLHTMQTIQEIPRWSNVWNHEGYSAGYFIDAAIAHYRWTGFKDARLYKAARKLADCWDTNIGPAPKKTWYDGHEALEQALIDLGRFVDSREGKGNGTRYIRLAKFLMDSRRNGDEYDQTHLPVVRQYEAAGHAVRAAYLYSAMQAYASQSGDGEYASAALSLWDNIVNRKYYVTGGIGSGETSEGFGVDYSLPNQAYCESCADCGELFFQHQLQLAYGDSRFTDLYEDTIYNAILGSVDLEAKNFFYTNALDSAERRYPWHVCPCCVGNIPRTLLKLPTWAYAVGPKDLYVNLYVGMRATVGPVAGVTVAVTQTTDYPWKGVVSLTLSPTKSRSFAVRLRIPNRNASDLYKASPNLGAAKLKVNGRAMAIKLQNGYAVVRRTWKKGDRIDLELPMSVQRITASPLIRADRERVALRYGPLIYSFEGVDQSLNSVLSPNTPLKLAWRPDLLGGVWAVTGSFEDGKPLLAIPNYARLNRGGRSVVWIKAR